MHVLGVRDKISVPVRIDSVRTVPNKYHGAPELRIAATLQLSPNAEENTSIVLWASADRADVIIASQEFTPCDITLEAFFDNGNDGSPVRARVAVSAIWFGKPSDENIALVMS